MRISAAAVLSLLASPAASAAQGFSASRYAAPLSADDLVATERAMVTPHLGVGGLLAVDWAHSLAGVAVEDRVTAHAVASVGFFDRAQLAVALPVVLSQQLRGGPSLAPGDLRIDARVRIAGLPRRGSARVALAATLLVPTGDRGAFAGDGAFGFVPRVIVEVNNARDFVFAANVGVAVRPGWEHQFTARLGVTVPIVARVVVAVEGLFETSLLSPGATGAMALETLGGVRYTSRSGIGVGLSAGPRFIDGAGAADLRVVGLFGYAPRAVEGRDAPGDRDRDGVIDPDDRCPDEPAGPRPDPRRTGCPRVERERAVTVEVVPDVDRDGDGVLDPSDACPDDAGVATGDPTTTGCPRVFVRADRVVITQQPRFDVDRDVILAESVPLLTEVAAVLERHTELALIEVQGHTDDQGTASRNMDLSRRRAGSIRAWLVGHGIAPERLRAEGYGESRPIADNGTMEGRASNRRVEFVVRERVEGR